MSKFSFFATSNILLHPKYINLKLNQMFTILEWKVASRALATNLEKNYHHIGTHAMCLVCGREDESSFHALVAWPNAATLWDSMKLQWPLPDRVEVKWTGKEWLLHLLADQPERTRDMILLLLYGVHGTSGISYLTVNLFPLWKCHACSLAAILTHRFKCANLLLRS